MTNRVLAWMQVGRFLRRGRWLASCLLALLCLLAGGAGAQPTSGFDHLSTGFALTGAHNQTRCESCHQDGVLKGTPRDCASCHQSGKRLARGNVVLPANHVATTSTCDTCHTTKSFVGARFDHKGVTAGSCASCHDGVKAVGRPANHVAYQAVAGLGSAACDSCHKSGFASWGGARVHAHFTVTTGCASCHAGGALGAVSKPATPIHANATACESCHSTTGWAGAKVDHNSFTAATSCASCHNGGTATGKSAQHIPVGSTNCFSCHSVSGWKPSKWTHAQMSVAGQCATCHSGGYPPADGRSSQHVPYTSVAATASATCDTCHKSGFGSWTPAKVHANTSISSGCSSCHTGAFPPAVGKPSNALHASVTGNCESCHKSTSTWSSAKVDHGGFNASTNCASCHNGSSASGKSATHIPVGSTNCFSCHSVTGWTPTKWTHAQVTVTAQCASCHTGGYPPADGKSATHVPYASNPATATANCDTCHKSGFAAWSPAKVHANASISTGCSSCHTGAFPPAVGKPSNALHATVTGNCESCHKSTSSWSSAKVDHSGFNASTTCASCHNGSTATGKSGTHIPVGGTNCFSCHSVTGWTPTKFTHTQVTVTAQCASCHTGGYPPADGKSPTHVPYASNPATAAANCDTCHKSGFSTWTPAKVHANASISTGCSSCHTGAFPPAVGKPSNALHATVTGNCESCHKSTSSWSSAKVDHSGFNASTTCASCHNGSTATGKSGTHIPVGSTNCFSCHSVTGWTPTKFTHTQVTVTAQCASCHTGGYPPADGKSPTHVPYASNPATAAANCDTCHKSGFSTWTPAKVHANASVSTGCSSCHTGAFPPAVGKPSNALHATVTGNCESCHKSTSSWASAKVDHSGFNASTSCASCHNGGTATGKPGTHVPVGSTNCFSCHSVTGWTPTKWTHTQVTVTAQCATCHTGGYPPADGKSPTHVPYASNPATAAANCDSCHKSGFSTWTPAKVHANASISTGCSSCHTGAFPPAVGKPSNALHATVTGNCESCHKSTSNWSSAKVDHSGFNASTTCASCHNGSTATGKSGTHIPVGSTNCFSCHSVTGWTPTKFTHTQVTVTAQCASCHTGGYPPADGKSATHVPYASNPATAAANCDTCHKSGFSTWTPAKVHANASISTGCSSCHTGAFPPAVGKPNNALHATVTGNCESCHKSTSNWSSAKVDHSGFNASTTCASCHNGSTATGKSGTHIPVGSTNCFSCHSVTGWTPTKFTHTQVTVTAQCASCHTGGYPPADGKSPTHVPYASNPATAAANCDTCHKSGFSTWTPAKVHANASIPTGCSSCHTGAFPPAVGKPNNALHATVTGNCESCHKSTSNWSSAKVDHSGFNASTTCASCHNGGTATGKPGTHIPVGATNCFSCHGVTGWTPTKWTHTQVTVTAQCATCHTGGYPPADGRPANHVPYTAVTVFAAANCDTCHKGSFSTWSNGRVHANASISNGCSTCHSGAYLGAQGKPSNALHATITSNCESCHKSTSNWSTVTFAHSPANAVGTGTCDTCHNGGTATGKPASHIPVPAGAARCDSCHRSQAAWKTSLTMNHAVVTTGTCKSCHGGSYTGVGALAKPGNHIPEVQLLSGASMDCNACHTSTTSFGTMKMNHNNSQGNGAGWCKACHDKATNYSGGMERKSLTHEKKTGVTDCSQSGCHRPLGNKGNAYTKWD